MFGQECLQLVHLLVMHKYETGSRVLDRLVRIARQCLGPAGPPHLVFLVGHKLQNRVLRQLACRSVVAALIKPRRVAILHRHVFDRRPEPLRLLAVAVDDQRVAGRVLYQVHELFGLRNMRRDQGRRLEILCECLDLGFRLARAQDKIDVGLGRVHAALRERLDGGAGGLGFQHHKDLFVPRKKLVHAIFGIEAQAPRICIGIVISIVLV